MTTSVRSIVSRFWTGIRDGISVQLFVGLAVGILAGYSAITIVSTDVVTLPIAGAVSGQVLGVLGLVMAAAAYQWTGCGTCGSASDCGCSGGCNDRCSYDD
ncbi:hypothetical protein [Natronorubrum sp. FCH18a]|uniref:hypothetical protein n=1 Tax=Natronorubrum sp. FCH18a TaxID=3447018 RepID=UPI003F51707C